MDDLHKKRDPLSKKTIEKLLKKRPRSLPKTQRDASENVMTSWDMLLLERAEREVIAAQTAVTENGYRKAVLKAEHERLLQAIGVDLTQAHNALAEAKANHAKFLKELENRYSVSWQTHGYTPETGVINPIDP